MSKSAITIFFLLVFGFAFGQTERGRFLIGGSCDISAVRQGDVRGFNLALSPSFGAFVVKNFVVGGRYSFGVSSQRVFNVSRGEYVTTTTFTSQIGPLLRYYVGKKALKGLVSANANYITTTTLRGGNVSGNTGFSATGLLGMAFFLNKHISLESGMYITGSSLIGQLPSTRIGFSVGLFAFLNGKMKKEETPAP